MISNKQPRSSSSSLINNFIDFFFLALGAFVAAYAIESFLIPNQLIDGGTVGISMILSKLMNGQHLSQLIIGLTLPFVIIAYRSLGKHFVLRMSFALILFATFCYFLQGRFNYNGEPLEIVVFGGFCLGAGIGLIIRMGGCVDGSEIIAILMNKKYGFTVGQVILAFNIVIFLAAALVFGNWAIALRSLLVYMVAYKIIDLVINGFDETKSVMIISTQSEKIASAIMNEMGLALTVVYGRGGFSRQPKEILYVVIERLQLVELKLLVHREDPSAFISITNLHEIVHGQKIENK